LHWYIAIHGLKGFNTVDRVSIPLEHSRISGLSDTVRLLDKYRKDLPIEGVYYGNEFCERLLPEPDELQAALEKAGRKGLSLVLLTPYLTDSGIEMLAPLLEIMDQLDGPEVVLNDWGAIRYVKSNFPGITPVTGRLMSRMMKEIRIARRLKPGMAPDGALDALKDCGYSNGDYSELLSENGIKRVEFDIPPQGLGVRLDTDIMMSVHVPFGYICTGRICMPGSLSAKPEHKFTPFVSCSRECTRWTLRLREEKTGSSGTEPLLFQKGNTVFYLEEPSLIEDVFSGSGGNGMDRIIIDSYLFC
jgi:hypothetical protein